MRVLFISSGNLSKGRPSILISNQGKSLVKQGIEVEYYSIKGKGVLGYLNSIPSISKKIKKINPTIVHSHYSLSAFATTLALFAYRLKFPHYVSLMGSDSKMKGWKRTLTRLLSRYTWYTTIVKAESMATDLNIYRYEIIPNGVDLSNLSPVKSTYSRIVLFPADPARESKNFSLAQEAFERVKEILPSIKLEVCYGIPHESMITKLQESAVVLITSLWEGSPNIVKEAMALNKPIVCTRVGDTEWLLDAVEGAYLVDNDANQIADKIKESFEFIDSSGLSNGRDKIICLNLDSVQIAKKLIRLYEEA